MKKFLSVILAVLLVMSLFSVSASATKDEAVTTYTSGDYEYILLKDGTAEISKYIGSETEVTIPATLDGYTVTLLGDRCFNRYYDLVNLSIPDTVIVIEEYAFGGCENLTSVTIPDSVTILGEGAFAACLNLTELNISNNLPLIGDYAFSDCESLTDVVLPNSVTDIGKYAFANCYALKSITIPKSVAYIDIGAFIDCRTLTDLYIEDLTAWCNIELEFRESNPFNYSYNDEANLYVNNELVTNLVIPEDVTKISDYAFLGATGFESVTLGSNVTYIGDSAFMHCRGIDSLIVSKSLKEVNNDSFYDCPNLKNIHIEDLSSWLSVDFFDYVLSNSGGNIYLNDALITELVIPEDITYIANYAFYNCTSLTDIKFHDEVRMIGFGAFRRCTGLTEVDFPESLSYIGGCAFGDCYNLEKVPPVSEGMTIEYLAFVDCTSLESITLPRDSIMISYDAFGYVSDEETSSYKPDTNFVVYGYTGSKAEEDALNNGFTFIDLEKKDTVINLEKNKATVYLTGTAQIKATVENGDGQTTYTSSNTKVATVNSKGKVTAKKAGKAVITVTNNGVSEKFAVTVKKPTLNKSNKVLNKGKSFTLKITGQVGKAKFTTSDKKIAKVNSKGKITAKKKGQALIKVKTNGITLKCKVKVK